MIDIIQLSIKQLKMNQNQFKQRDFVRKARKNAWLPILEVIKAGNPLSTIKILSLCGNRIQSLEGFQYLSNLQQLTLYTILKIIDNNHVKKIDFIQSLTKLNKLQISDNSLQVIENLSNLELLTIINFTKNKILQIQNLQGLKLLSQLILQYNPIKTIKNISDLYNLSQLILTNCQIQSIQNLSTCSNLHLKTLNLQKNNISCLKSMRKMNLPQLTYLNIEYNIFPQITQFSQLASPKLSKLVFKRWEFEKIENIDQLFKLQSSNEIKQLYNTQRIVRYHNKNKRIWKHKFKNIILSSSNVSQIAEQQQLQSQESSLQDQQHLQENQDNLFYQNVIIKQGQKQQQFNNRQQMLILQKHEQQVQTINIANVDVQHQDNSSHMKIRQNIQNGKQ